MSAATTTPTRRRDSTIFRVLIQAKAKPGVLSVGVGARVRSAIVTDPAVGLDRIKVPGRVVEIHDDGCVIEFGGNHPGLTGERYVPWAKVLPVPPAAPRACSTAPSKLRRTSRAAA